MPKEIPSWVAQAKQDALDAQMAPKLDKAYRDSIVYPDSEKAAPKPDKSYPDSPRFKALRGEKLSDEGMINLKKGGKVASSASKRADGIAQRGKTRGTMVAMCGGGMYKK